jgi:hypothetical protein
MGVSSHVRRILASRAGVEVDPMNRANHAKNPRQIVSCNSMSRGGEHVAVVKVACPLDDDDDDDDVCVCVCVRACDG